MAILDAGAYGSVMASTYNRRPLLAEVLIDDERRAATETTATPPCRQAAMARSRGG